MIMPLMNQSPKTENQNLKQFNLITNQLPLDIIILIYQLVLTDNINFTNLLNHYQYSQKQDLLFDLIFKMCAANYILLMPGLELLDYGDNILIQNPYLGTYENCVADSIDILGDPNSETVQRLLRNQGKIQFKLLVLFPYLLHRSRHLHLKSSNVWNKIVHQLNLFAGISYFNWSNDDNFDIDNESFNSKIHQFHFPDYTICPYIASQTFPNLKKFNMSIPVEFFDSDEAQQLFTMTPVPSLKMIELTVKVDPIFRPKLRNLQLVKDFVINNTLFFEIHLRILNNRNVGLPDQLFNGDTLINSLVSTINWTFQLNDYVENLPDLNSFMNLRILKLHFSGGGCKNIHVKSNSLCNLYLNNDVIHNESITQTDRSFSPFVSFKLDTPNLNKLRLQNLTIANTESSLIIPPTVKSITFEYVNCKTSKVVLPSQLESLLTIQSDDLMNQVERKLIGINKLQNLIDVDITCFDSILLKNMMDKLPKQTISEIRLQIDDAEYDPEFGMCQVLDELTWDDYTTNSTTSLTFDCHLCDLSGFGNLFRLFITSYKFTNWNLSFIPDSLEYLGLTIGSLQIRIWFNDCSLFTESKNQVGDITILGNDDIKDKDKIEWDVDCFRMGCEFMFIDLGDLSLDMIKYLCVSCSDKHQFVVVRLLAQDTVNTNGIDVFSSKYRVVN
ncbi:unnamed protein product [Ambrosiozyma monospora]|uniref:Unnamed protein product n=1 Tax=Ambrosiozyma monospora TaxID=43982 RepID=A0ACB5STN8_AMBMO|nr:unnamed protein product [Ambrosiozyma monospora]